MWTTILLNGVLSIIIIFIANQLWEYCKINYTMKKTKNVVEFQANKYKQIAEDMDRNVNSSTEEEDKKQRDEKTGVLSIKENPLQPIKLKNTDFLPPEEKEWMDNELTSFINTL